MGAQGSRGADGDREHGIKKRGKSKKGVQVTELLQEAQDFLGAPSTEFHKTRSSTVALQGGNLKRMSQSPANYT